MGNSLNFLSSSALYVANEKAWIEGDALLQLQNSLLLKGMRKVVGMPDLHPGLGYPVGASFLSDDYIYPALIGNDIGCGMSFWQTSLKSHQINLNKLEKKWLNHQDLCDESTLSFYIENTPWQSHAFRDSLGSIGGGNHFTELQRVDKIFNEEIFSHYSLDKKMAFLLVHSGSRGYGSQILRSHVDKYNHQGLLAYSDAAIDYLNQHDDAINYAKFNRYLIAKRLLDALHSEGIYILDAPHNFVESIEINEKTEWIHRKGVSSTLNDLLVIPGSRGDYSYLVKPLKDENTLYSVAHGAGRKWIRSSCKARLEKRFTLNDLSQTKLGSRVICKDQQLLYEEAPEAYKNINHVIDSLKEAHLIEIVARFSPIMTYKTTRGR